MRADKLERLRALNDALRIGLTKPLAGPLAVLKEGEVFVTAGVAALPLETFYAVLKAVGTYDDFQAGDDPYLEHDFGSVKVDGANVFWKIDYYNKAMDAGSEDPSDPDVTARVLTIMLAEEY